MSPFRRRVVAMVALAMAALAAGAPALADCGGARDFVRAAGERAVAVLNAPGATDAQRVQGMSALLFEVADLPLIARLVLGRNWNSASQAQRTAYLDAFRIYALDSLAARFAKLDGGVRFTLLDRCIEVDDRDRLLATDVAMPSRPQPTRIDWRVRETDGSYRLIDVSIEGVSLVVSNRSEFDSVVQRQGLDALIAQIRGKNEPKG